MSWTDENFKISARSCYLHLTSPWDGTFKIHSSQMLGVLLMKCYFYIFELVFFTHIFHYIISKEVQRRYVFFCTFSSKFVYLAPEIRSYSIHYIFFVVQSQWNLLPTYQKHHNSQLYFQNWTTYFSLHHYCGLKIWILVLVGSFC